jgi:hypothetical protein
MAQGWGRTDHVRSLFLKTGRNLKATVRPNGVAAQAFEPSIPAKNRRQSLTMALIPQSF